MVKFQSYLFFEIVEYLMHHFSKYNLNPNDYEIILHNPTKTNHLNFRINKIKK